MCQTVRTVIVRKSRKTDSFVPNSDTVVKRADFVEGDERTNPQTTIKRAFAVILYSLAKASYGTIANLFNVSPSTVQKWLAKEAALLSEPEIPINTRELEFDEMWHFIGSKKTKDGFTKQFLVKQAKPLPGLSVVVMLIPSDGYSTK